jgi:Tol biopolymer transport system component
MVLFLVSLTRCSSLEFVIDATSYEPLHLLCVIDSRAHESVRTLVEKYVALLLRSTRQFDVVVRFQDVQKTKKYMQSLLEEGFPLVIFWEGTDKMVTWRLYDTMSVELIKGKEHVCGALSRDQWSIAIASALWPELTSERGSFASLIVACKHRAGKNGRMLRDIYLLHPFFTHDLFKPVKLVACGNNFAPRWHSCRDMIFFSRHAPTNVCLMSVDAARVVRTITSFDGQNMTPTISKKGRVVLSLSNNDSIALYEYIFNKQDKRGVFKRLTRAHGDFISPSFINEKEVVFCYVNDRNVPSLGIIQVDTQHVSWLSVGRAVCPAASPDGSRIAFCKKDHGTYQVYLYECATKQEEQLTCCVGNKDECSWSACGNYLVCCVEKGDSSRLALVDVHTKVLRYITPEHEKWSYPSWSSHLSLPFFFSKTATTVV